MLQEQINLYSPNHLPTGEGGNISLNLLQVLLLLFEGLQGLIQLVIGLVKLYLKAVDFLAVVSDVAVGLVSYSVGLLGRLFKPVIIIMIILKRPN